MNGTQINETDREQNQKEEMIDLTVGLAHTQDRKINSNKNATIINAVVSSHHVKRVVGHATSL